MRCFGAGLRGDSPTIAADPGTSCCCSRFSIGTEEVADPADASTCCALSPASRLLLLLLLPFALLLLLLFFFLFLFAPVDRVEKKKLCINCFLYNAY